MSRKEQKIKYYSSLFSGFVSDFEFRNCESCTHLNACTSVRMHRLSVRYFYRCRTKKNSTNHFTRQFAFI